MAHVFIRSSPVQVNGYRAIVYEVGDVCAPRIILLPSMLVLARSYFPTMRALAHAGLRVSAIEMPGAGQATKLDEPWSFRQYAEWLAEFWDAQELGCATLIGHSNSAAVALPYAAAHPEHVERLVLVDPIGGAGPARSLLSVVVRRAFDAVLFELPISAAGWHHVAYNMIRHAANFWNQVRLAAQTDLRELASHIKVPTLLGWGARDYTMGVFGLEVLRQVLPSAEVYISEAGSHDWIVARPQEFARMVGRPKAPNVQTART